MNKLYLFILLSLVACNNQTTTTPQVVPTPVYMPGPKGATGPTGAQGASLVSTSIPATTVECPAGGFVVMIAQDNQNSGVWSPNDTDQTSILVCNGTNAALQTVQFCPQSAVKYPSTFPEFGIVIDNTIYAVYWDGINAWLTEVPPGNYASTSTSAPCDFTVNNDGTIN